MQEKSHNGLEQLLMAIFCDKNQTGGILTPWVQCQS